MKTKVNKVPLVGPRGRRELLDRIEELEEKIKELENATPEPDPNAVKPIVLTGQLTTEMTTQAELDEIGLTVDEVLAAFQGKRTFVIVPDSTASFAISGVYVFGKTASISFYNITYDETGAINSMVGYSINMNIETGVVEVEYIDI